MPARKRVRNLRWLEWIAVIVLGGVLGSTLGALARTLLGDGPAIGFLTRSWTIGIAPPVVLDLRVLSFTFGATFDVGILTAVGIAVALWLYLKVR